MGKGWNLSDDDAEPVVEVMSAPKHADITRVSDGGDVFLATLLREARAIERPPARMIAEAKHVGELLGEDGFYTFPVGGKTIEGGSIDLAQALAGIWGGIANQVHIVESTTLAHGGRRIHFRARSMDLRSLVAAEVDGVQNTSAPPAKFARDPEQSERWHTMQAQSSASKMIRNTIFDVLPAWFVNAGLNAALKSAADDVTDGKTLEEARVVAFEYLDKLKVTKEECEQIAGKPVDLWASRELAALRRVAKQLTQRTLSVEQLRKDLAAAAEKAGETQPAKPQGSALGIKTKDAATPPPPAQGTTTATPTDAKPAADPPATATTDPAAPPAKTAAEEDAAEKFLATKNAKKGGAS